MTDWEGFNSGLLPVLPRIYMEKLRKNILVTRFQVLMAANMKMIVFFGCCEIQYYPDDGGSEHLWNFRKLLPASIMQQIRRELSSLSLTVLTPGLKLEYAHFRIRTCSYSLSLLVQLNISNNISEMKSTGSKRTGFNKTYNGNKTPKNVLEFTAIRHAT
jgi:hypothetical protein